MNLHSVFEELNKLYESEQKANELVDDNGKINNTDKCESDKQVKEDFAADDAVEATEDDVIETEDDEASEEESAEPAEDAPITFVLTCVKCGGIVLKAATEIKSDEKDSVVNPEEPCQYCEATDGYEVLGTLVPAEEAAEDHTETIDKPVE